MSRRLCIICAMIVFAYGTVSYGCSSASNSTLVPHSGTAVMREMPQLVGSWTTEAPMPTARGALAVGVVKGILYAVGGETCDTCNLNTVEAFDPATDTWTTKASMPTAREGFAAGVINGKLYAVGGIDANGFVLNTVEAYDPATDTWTTKASMPKDRWGLAAGVVNGILYAVGGADCTVFYPACSTKYTVYAYDPSTDAWSEKAGMPRARKELAVVVINGILYAVGGNNYRGPLNAVEAYDPATNAWTAKASMPDPRTELAAGAINGRLYAVGGCADRFCRHPLNVVESYDPVTNTWTTKASMPTARGLLAAGVVNGVLFAVGGWDGYDNPCQVVEAYNPR